VVTSRAPAVGSTSTATHGFSDWSLGGGETPRTDNTTVASTPYRNHTSGKNDVKTFVFATSMQITSGKTVASVTLRATLSQGSCGVFALAAG
jgi:hypothetical protein